MNLTNLFFSLLTLFFVSTSEKINVSTATAGSLETSMTIPGECIEDWTLTREHNLALRVPRDDGRISFDVFFVDLDHSQLQFFHQDPAGKKIKNISNLKSHLGQKSEKLLFATNGGMYNANLEPEGLYIENGEIQYPLNMEKDEPGTFTNFYGLPPNGVFYVTHDNQYGIVPRAKFSAIKNVKYATQSAPMALVNGEFNNKFKKESTSRHIRSGVGVAKKNGIMEKYELVFIISNERITFYDFARMFKYYPCEQALYLDGAISEMYIDKRYLKGKNTPINRPVPTNNFASMIAITEKN